MRVGLIFILSGDPRKHIMSINFASELYALLCMDHCRCANAGACLKAKRSEYVWQCCYADLCGHFRNLPIVCILYT